MFLMCTVHSHTPIYYHGTPNPSMRALLQCASPTCIRGRTILEEDLLKHTFSVRMIVLLAPLNHARDMRCNLNQFNDWVQMLEELLSYHMSCCLTTCWPLKIYYIGLQGFQVSWNWNAEILHGPHGAETGIWVRGLQVVRRLWLRWLSTLA